MEQTGATASPGVSTSQGHMNVSARLLDMPEGIVKVRRLPIPSVG